MSFRGGGGFRGGRGGGGFGGSRGGRGGFAPQGPPDQVYELGTFMHASEGEMVCNSTNVKIPYFNAPIYLENKTAVGKVDEILGPINQVYFTIKPQEGIVATSFKNGDKFFIGGDKLLPLERFLPKPKPAPGAPKVKKPAGRGGARGGFGDRGRGGFSRGGRGGSRGGFGGDRGGRGGFGGRGGSRGGFGGDRGGRGGFQSRGGSGGFGGRGGGRGRGGY
ncbi:hypothetical protein E4T47_07971 [Aureobasidium subglaciale]|nr:hypothetical protein E4T43_08320 [Aureobasidium subglaciale]KAI5267726.1 hypothetical protein E4T47_07971 [Aureobasidium subglaciale]